MAGADEQHAQTALTDAAAHGQGQLVVQHHLVERQLPAGIAAGQRQLTAHGFCVYADTHRAQLHGTAQNFVPNQNIAVQRPVVIVGCPTVVRLTGFQLAADLHQKHALCAGVFHELGFFLGRGVTLSGIAVFQLLTGYEYHVTVNFRGNGGEFFFQRLMGIGHSVNNALHGVLQRIQIPLFPGNHLFPIPLVHVSGVQVVKGGFLRADCVHIAVQTVAHMEVIPFQRQTFPFCQRLHDFHLGAQCGNGERYRMLFAAQVIIQTGSGGYKQRGGNPFQMHLLAQLHLKFTLDEFNGALQIVSIQRRTISSGNVDDIH